MNQFGRFAEGGCVFQKEYKILMACHIWHSFLHMMMWVSDIHKRKHHKENPKKVEFNFWYLWMYDFISKYYARCSYCEKIELKNVEP